MTRRWILGGVLSLLLSGIGQQTYGQEAGSWWGLQGKVIGGVGVVAEGPIGAHLYGTVGVGWLVLIIDGFVGVITHTRSPLNFFGRVHLIEVADITLPLSLGTSASSASDSERLFLGWEPGVRLRLGRVLLEGGLILFEAGSGLRPAPNVGLLVRLGKL